MVENTSWASSQQKRIVGQRARVRGNAGVLLFMVSATKIIDRARERTRTHTATSWTGVRPRRSRGRSGKRCGLFDTNDDAVGARASGARSGPNRARKRTALLAHLLIALSWRGKLRAAENACGRFRGSPVPVFHRYSFATLKLCLSARRRLRARPYQLLCGVVIPGAERSLNSHAPRCRGCSVGARRGLHGELASRAPDQ